MSCVSVLTQHSLLLDSSYFYKVLNIEQNLHFWVCSVSWSQLYPLSHHCVGYTVLYEIVPHRCTVHIQGIMTVAEAAGGNLTRKLYFQSLLTKLPKRRHMKGCYFSGYFQRARHHAKCRMYVISFKPPTTLQELVLLSLLREDQG